ncbi:EthD family reductase [Pseudomonas sp. SLFW]|uniref:EthD family reductase n=1 Tax=Pseudomonas sp. SLFW TaxID=2683259 RepID=UPI001412EFA2|nr:EthD family reductase [Pseudomonas sp. SLFW]
MIKISVMYPSGRGIHFNHRYYRDVHLPLVKRRLGDHLISYGIDKGLSGMEPDSAPLYVGLCHLYCESVEAFQAGIAPHGEELENDIANFTNASPVYQISEVVQVD